MNKPAIKQNEAKSENVVEGTLGRLERKRFARKTFIVLLYELTFTLICMNIVLFIPPIRDYFNHNPSVTKTIALAALIINIIVNMSIACIPVLRKPPHMILFSVFGVLSMTVMLIMVAVLTDQIVVVIAIVIVVFLVLALLFLSLTKFDFTKRIVFAYVTMFVLLLFLMVCVVCFKIFNYQRTNWFELTVSVCVILVYSMFILIEFQLILGGKKYTFDENLEFFAAYSLYSLITLMLMFMFRIVGTGDDIPTAH